MRKRAKQVSTMLLAVILAMSSMTSPAQAKTPVASDKEQAKVSNNHKTAPYKEGEAVVMYYGRANQKYRASASQAFGDDITIEDTYDFTESQLKAKRNRSADTQELLVSKVSSKTYSTEKLIEKLEKQENVAYAEPNYICKPAENQDEQNFMQYQWALKNVGQNGGTKGCDINVESAWQKKTGTDKVIAVVDTGVDDSHPALAGNMWENPYQDKLKGEHGYDFKENDDDPFDEDGHGTHCAGIIAGNGTAISGINKSAKIMALKFMYGGDGGDTAGAIAAYDYINRAIDLGVNVVAINNSWSGGDGSEILEKVINIVGQKGAISVIAAGNKHSDVDIIGNEPWTFSSDYAIKVAASNEKDELAAFSNYGKSSIDLAAPGVDILSSVSYEQYNPSIHIDDKEYSEVLDTFETKEEVEAYKKTTEAEGGTMELSTGEGRGFGATENNSLEFKVDHAVPKKMYVTYRPITLPQSETEYYTSAVVKLSGDSSTYHLNMGVNKVSEIESMELDFSQGIIGGDVDGDIDGNYWDLVSGSTFLNECTKEDDYAVWFSVYTDAESNLDIQIDNVGFSKKDMTMEEFGQYSFYNGTSMAAPQVTGAVALISEIEGKMDPRELRETVVRCVRKSEALEDKVITGGVLDLSKLDTLGPVIKTATADDQTITIMGSWFGEEKGSVTVDGTEVAIKEWNQNQIVVEDKEKKNRELTLKVNTSKNDSTEKRLYVEQNMMQMHELAKDLDFGASVIATDGMNLYALDENGFFSTYSKETGEYTRLEPLKLSAFDKNSIDEITGESKFTYETQLIYANEGLYTVVDYDAGYYHLKTLIFYNIKTDQWKKVADLPDELINVEYSTLAAYGEKLYLIGGYDKDMQRALETVYSMDYKIDTTFKEESIKVPARFGAVAQIVGNQLVLTLGGDGTIDQDINDDSYASVPNTIVFDGTNFREIKDTSFAASGVTYYNVQEDTGIPYYTAQTGVYKDGIIYADLYSKDFGNVFTYNLKENKYKALPCSLYGYRQDGSEICGTTIADQFMFLAGYDLQGRPCIDDNRLYSFDVETGFYQVTADTDAIDGVGYYYPQSRVVITPKVAEGQYLKKFTVGGREINDKTYTILALDQDTQVQITLGSLLKQAAFDKLEYAATVGQPLSLSLHATTGNGESITAADQFTWTVDNTTYATVENGVVAPLQSGAGKFVTVTAKAKDGSDVSASVIVRIAENKVKATSITLDKNKIQLKANESHKLQAGIEPSTASDKNVTWESSNSSVAMVSSDGEVLARNPGKAVITVRTTDGSNLAATCEVQVAPGTVSKLKAKQTTNTVTLSWGKVNGASGYTIYRYDKKSKKDVEVATLNSTNKVSIKISKLNGAKGSRLAPGTEYTYRVAAFVNVGNKKLYGGKSTITTATRPARTKVTKVQRKSSRTVQISWNKVKDTTGYELYVATNKKGKFKKIAVCSNAKKTNYKQSGLKRRKTYYYKVRTYKKVGRTVIYGDYSITKSFRMK